jgi:hypothetical protein
MAPHKPDSPGTHGAQLQVATGFRSARTHCGMRQIRTVFGTTFVWREFRRPMHVGCVVLRCRTYFLASGGHATTGSKRSLLTCDGVHDRRTKRQLANCFRWRTSAASFPLIVSGPLLLLVEAVEENPRIQRTRHV